MIRRLLALLTLAAASAFASTPGGSPAALPETCYLFAYFYHDKEAEGFRLAWSADGYEFRALNGGRSFITPTAGEKKLMRDPHLFRGPDGRWHLVWTTGWTGRDIGYASSADLIHWSEQKTLPVMAHEPEAQNCWAPELIWDAAKQRYLLFWSTTILGKFPETEMSNRRRERNHRIYATATKDFVTFEPTWLLYDGGYNVIDANLIPAADGTGDWLMFVKDETFAPVTQKNIRLVRGRSPEGPWDRPSAPLTGNYWAEGPTSIKVGDEYRVYFDKHMLDAIGLVRSRDLQTWEDVGDRIKMPAHARHGCIVTVTRAELAPLLALPAQP
jgi:hypothetical protein